MLSSWVCGMRAQGSRTVHSVPALISVLSDIESVTVTLVMQDELLCSDTNDWYFTSHTSAITIDIAV